MQRNIKSNKFITIKYIKYITIKIILWNNEGVIELKKIIEYLLNSHTLIK